MQMKTTDLGSAWRHDGDRKIGRSIDIVGVSLLWFIFVPFQILTGIAAFLSVSMGAVAIGGIFGFVTALVTLYTNEVRVVEPLAVIGLAYMAYLTAELVHFSGIIAIICCGLIQVCMHNNILV